MGLFEFGSEYDSRYLRVIPNFYSKSILELSENVSVLFMNKLENESLSNKVRKRNVFARHSWENNFYIDRLTTFCDKTVISIVQSGTPQDMQASASELSEFVEHLLIIGTIFSLDREALQKKYFSTLSTPSDYDFAYSQDMKYLKSRTLSKRRELINIDDSFIQRFGKLGFNYVFDYYNDTNELVERIKKSVHWLYESRIEKNLNAAIVKTSIALESLLIFSDSESLSKSLSERTALILTNEPKLRSIIGKTVTEFYNARSGIVHGGKKRIKNINNNVLETMDRLLALVIILICSNRTIWDTNESLRLWCENQKWGTPYENIYVHFSKSYLSNAIKHSKIDFDK